MLKFSTVVLVLGSLLVGLVLLYAVSESLPGDLVRGGVYAGAYAALALEEADGETVPALERALGRPVLSEFSQSVLLNNFSGLEWVPLGEYEERLEPFDPRRDGYAVKLRDFFTRDGKRWFFIPLDRAMFGPVPDPERLLKQRIARALGEEPFALVLKREGRSLGLRVLPFALAWPAVLFLAEGAFPFRKRRDARRGRGEPNRRMLLLLGPPLFALSLGGAPGCVLAALFLYLAVLLTPCLRELWVRVLRGGGKEPRWVRGPYRFNVVVSLVLAPPLVLVLWLARVPPLPGLGGLAGLGVLYVCCLGVQVRRRAGPGLRAGAPGGPESCRFVPLPILSPRPERSPLPVPFALASCLAFLLNLPVDLPIGVPAGLRGGTAEPWPVLVSEQDYEDHVRYQTGFARRSLREDAAFAISSYFHYTMGEDGLVVGVLPGLSEAEYGLEAGPDIPPFPLADLSDFLAGWADPSGPSWNSGGWTALIPPFLGLGLVFLPLGRSGGIAVNDDKRIAA